MTVSSQVKQTLAGLKNCHSTLRIYAVQTQDQETRNVYEEALDTTNEIIKNLEERLKAIEFQEPRYKGN
ncbi:Protein of unknown function [Geosporobacter subterraneus DSM 17957]|uniref:DUF1657 domain-containing protein n=1 Tax=Geosporobacter subterraneus DSM 17957 TaxID=1121919 RepID=A0A1M6PPU3_9FIRM|nr:DUF1657 domain-containing protein [Geosporobacter subterraneus]SHK09937.1 Protein of unknown function [Geosporobacter subterraneus DSM 17957]